MKIRILSLPFALLVILTALVSCANTKPGPDKNPQGGMHPSDEYNYILTPEYWGEFADQAMGIANADSAKSANLIDFPGALASGGYGEPKISGQTDGQKILLNGMYPIIEDKKAFTEIFSKLPSGKVGFSGRVPPDKLIAYCKLPGVQGIFDAVHDYYQTLIDKGETKSKANPVTQVTGVLMMARVDIQEDIFSWMGPEMGFVMYKAVDPEKKEYLNTAFAMSIRNKAKTQEKIAMLLKIASGVTGQKIDKPLLTREKYKSYDMDILDSSLFDPSKMGFGGSEAPGEKSSFGIFYTDDYLFISDSYGLKQLADIYDPKGVPGESSTIAAYLDWDALLKYSPRYQEYVINEYRNQFSEMPKNREKFEEYYKRFKEMSTGKVFGKSKVLLNIKPEGLQVDMETTKSVIELTSFVNEWFTESMKVDEKPVEASTEGKV